MSLKTLLLPFSITLTLIIVIGYIKPDIATLQEKRIILETKTNQAQSMDTLIANVSSLEAALDAQAESAKLVDAFVPRAFDQERVIDTFNYLASQSGVLVSIMAMGASEKKASNTLDPVSGEEVRSFKPKVETFSASVSVKGSYEGISDFFSRLAHANRFHAIRNFSLAVPTESVSEESGILLGRFESEFDYFPMLRVGNALDVPVFTRGSFDEARLAEMTAWQRHAVPTLQAPLSGRPNPFQ